MIRELDTSGVSKHDEADLQALFDATADRPDAACVARLRSQASTVAVGAAPKAKGSWQLWGLAAVLIGAVGLSAWVAQQDVASSAVEVAVARASEPAVESVVAAPAAESNDVMIVSIFDDPALDDDDGLFAAASMDFGFEEAAPVVFD